MASSISKPLDYAAYLKLPETMRRYDIVEGVLRFLSPGPDIAHQEILRRIFLLLDGHVEKHDLGEVYFAPLDVIITKVPLHTRQPDLMYISNTRRYILQDQVCGGPDLVVEVLSPGNPLKRVQEKLRAYASVEVREAWVVDPKQKTVAVLHLRQREFLETAVFGAGRRLRSKVLPRLALPVGRIFTEQESDAGAPEPVDRER